LEGETFSNTPIESITIPKTLEIVNWYSSRDVSCGPFYNCTKLKTINFESGITGIPRYLFAGCQGIEKVTIPNTVTTINDGAFKDCINLKTVELPDSVTEMGDILFDNCTSLTTVHIPSATKQINRYMFRNCKLLTTINLPDTLTAINEYAFYGCASLSSFRLPDSVQKVDNYAFYGCTSLSDFTCGENLTEIGSYAFRESGLTSFVSNSALIKIGQYAFYDCDNLATVTLSDNLKTIGEYAFAYNEALASVSLGAGITDIPRYAFYEDSVLEHIVFPYQVKTVGDYAFGNCTKLVDATINQNVTSISSNAFSYPAKMTVYGVSGSYAEEYASGKGIAFVPLETETQEVILNKTEITLGKGETYKLNARLYPENSVEEVTWTSMDETIATVDENGNIKAVAVGSTSILAMSGAVIVQCDITVYQPVSSVYINEGYSYEGTVGSTVSLTVTVYPSDATNKNVTWTSSDSGIASVDENGLVTLNSYGTAEITVTTEDKGKTDKYTVKVSPVAVTGVSIEKNVSLDIGDTYELEPIITPENATNKIVTWTSSKPSVATVTDGRITAVSQGTAIIIVKTKDGNKTASCTVTVSNNAKYNIAYELNGGTNNSLNPVSYKTDTDVIVLRDATRVGYSFLGWYTDSGFTNKISQIDASCTGNITLYAKWEWKTYDITYEADENTSVDINNVFTEEELAGGGMLQVEIKVDSAPSEMLGADENRLLEEISPDSVFAAFMDIVLVKKIDGEVVGNITDLENEITITIDIPQEYIGTERRFFIIRLHDNVPTILEDLDDNPNTVTIKTDKFSLYTLAYEDTNKGYSLYGTVTSYASSKTASDTISIDLYDISDSSMSTALYHTESTSDSYGIENVRSGNYIMSVSKENHVTRCYNITVLDSDIEQDVTICLKGDVTGDGKVNAQDWNAVRDHISYADRIADDYKFKCADVTNDGRINAQDWNAIRDHISYAKRFW
ncbi:MAG: leucine-rich repeat protein, partial [Clostridium sp.]|nr:leucine-rich repeat protein [Clostridium sp.]